MGNLIVADKYMCLSLHKLAQFIRSHLMAQVDDEDDGEEEPLVTTTNGNAGYIVVVHDMMTTTCYFPA